MLASMTWFAGFWIGASATFAVTLIVVVVMHRLGRHRHKWGRWGAPYQTKWVREYDDGRFQDLVRTFQNRICETCGQVDRREVGLIPLSFHSSGDLERSTTPEERGGGDA